MQPVILIAQLPWEICIKMQIFSHHGVYTVRTVKIQMTEIKWLGFFYADTLCIICLAKFVTCEETYASLEARTGEQ